MGMRSLLRRGPPVVPVGTYTQWSWPSSRSGYDEMRWELEPRSDPTPVGYFWSHQVGLVGGEAAYFGLQTEGAEPTGKIAIFSVWGAIDAESPEHAAPFSGEGSGMTVRIRYQWAPGRRERLRLQTDGEGWWTAEVGGRQVGRIRVDQAWGGLASTSIMWTERYAPPLRTCGELGYAAAWFGTPVADGVSPLDHHSYLASHRGCPGSSVNDAEGGVVQIMGATG
ncbi:MAG: hypothetical protein J2P57_09445 [Acidimicrobiaceae bacterium]|nr:hypothetical protein [Acidimicrobiaceae bacterium]